MFEHHPAQSTSKNNAQILWMEKWEFDLLGEEKLFHRLLLCLMSHLLILGLLDTTGVCSSIENQISKGMGHDFMENYKWHKWLVGLALSAELLILAALREPSMAVVLLASSEMVLSRKKWIWKTKNYWTPLRAWNSELKWIFLVFKMFLWIKFYEKFVFSPAQVCSFTVEYFSGLGISSLSSFSYIWDKFI